MTRADDERFGVELTQSMTALRRRAMTLTRNAADASDLAQQTLLKAWQSRHQFQGGTNLRAWLMCIMRNTHMSELRIRGREMPDGLSDYAEGLVAPASQEWTLTARRVDRAIAALPRDQAQAIIFVGALGESYHEGAVRFGCPEGTLKSRVSRVRQALREATEADQLFVHD